MSMSRFIPFLALLIATALGGCASSSGTKVHTTTADGDVVTSYDDPSNGLRFTYPGDWQEQSLPAGSRPKGTVIVLTGPGEVDGLRMPPTLSVVSQPAGGAATDGADPRSALEKMQAVALDRARSQFANFRVVDDGRPDTLGGAPARRFAFVGSKLNVTVQVMNVVALVGGRQYGFSYSADPEIFEQHHPAVERMLESVQWLR